MNKTTKAAVAAGASAALLLGGAGSLAYWNATSDIDGGTINSGELTLTADGAAAWRLNGAVVPDPTAVILVPGDELIYTGSYTIGAQGDNLQADVAVTGAAGAGTLAPYLTTDLTYELDGVASVAEITEANDGDALDVSIDIDFPFKAATIENESQLKALNLSALSVTLTQTDATP